MCTFFEHVQLTWYSYHGQRSYSSGTVLVIVHDCYMFMFLHLSVSHSVHRGGGLHPEGGLNLGVMHLGGLHLGGYASRGGSASRRGLHPGGVCIQGVMHLGGLHLGSSASRGVCIQRVVGQPRPTIRYYEIQSTSRRYASYWNAFLL